jgi:hypothetical protein
MKLIDHVSKIQIEHTDLLEKVGSLQISKVLTDIA